MWLRQKDQIYTQNPPTEIRQSLEDHSRDINACVDTASTVQKQREAQQQNSVCEPGESSKPTAKLSRDKWIRFESCSCRNSQTLDRCLRNIMQKLEMEFRLNRKAITTSGGEQIEAGKGRHYNRDLYKLLAFLQA